VSKTDSGEIMKKENIDYILTNSSFTPNKSLKIVYQNSSFKILKLND